MAQMRFDFTVWCWSLNILVELSAAMASQFTLRRRVGFSETDLAGIMHFSNFFRWMEETEHAFYRSLGLSVHPLAEGASDVSVGWPRVSAKCDYHLPLRFEEEVDVELVVSEVRTKSIRLRFFFRKLDEERHLAAVGELAVVSVTSDPSRHSMDAVPIPDRFREAIQAAPDLT